MVSRKNKYDCCGCGACVAICRNKAIELKEDKEGFLYPVIDEPKCTECGLCDRVCAFNKTPDHLDTQKQYIAQHSDADVCNASTSGGMYTAFSDVILNQNGVIYAPDFDEDMSIVHMRITTKEARNHSRGSKYVQSAPNGFHNNLIDDLKAGRVVGYFGTPCQVAGVVSYVPDKYKDNLYCVDVICNGVGSPMVWKQFAKRIEEKYRAKLDKYIFRPKTQGYDTHSEVAVFQNGRMKELVYSDSRYNPYYYSGIIMRPSCTNCVYTTLDRVADISIGDYSKIQDAYGGLERKLGLSTLLINNAKGEKLLALCGETLKLYPCSMDEVFQLRLTKCSEEHPERRAFLNNVSEQGFDKVHDMKYGFLMKLKIRVAPIIRKIIK